MPKALQKSKKPDKYDQAVRYLRRHPRHIFAAWCGGYFNAHPASCLFQAASRSGSIEGEIGCLTAIRGNGSVAANARLTKIIRADKQIPASDGDIRVKHLPHFARWQRRLDRELGRKTTQPA